MPGWGDELETADSPTIDGRDRDDILNHLKRIAPYYTEQWDPEKEDSGTVIFNIFSDFAEDIISRLDQLPKKHRAAFLNALDFETHPPQPAKLPLTFTVSDSASEPVTVPPGTTAVADGTDERSQQRFETITDEPFEATSATITDCYGIDPGTDRIVDHRPVLDGNEKVELFTGENLQTHAYYLGHSDLLNLNPGSTIELEITTNAPVTVFRDYLEWEYYGDNEAGETGWHSLEVAGRQEHDLATLSEFQWVESFIHRQKQYLEGFDYKLLSDHPEYDLLVRSIIDDIRKGRFGSPSTTSETEHSPELPANLFDDPEIDETLVEGTQRRLTALRERLRSRVFENTLSREFETQTITLEIPGTVTETEIDDVETRWIRCRIAENELSSPLFNILIDSVRLSVGTDQTDTGRDLKPDLAVTNDVVLELDSNSTQLLLGEYPTEAATFHLACEEAFTKPGATVTITFEGEDSEPSEATDVNPELVWEYWNGNGWRRLSVEDTTDMLQSSGTITFEAPTDIAATSVGGHEKHWIRTRLVSGNYGEIRVEATDQNNWERLDDHISPPAYETISLQYNQSECPFERQFTYNNLTFEDVTAAKTEIKPFASLPGEKQTLYLGFDRPLAGGPIQLYISMEEAVYPHEFNPWIDIEYCSDPSIDEWTRLTSRDGTGDLTERGILGVTFPEETTSFSLFGKERHWIRIRLTRDEFARSESGLFAPVRSTELPATNRRELSTTSISERERSERTRTPPVVDGFYLNTAWAKNTVSIDEETLGSSNETANATYRFSQAPILNATVWVDELNVVSQREQQRLENDSSTDIEKEFNSQGELTAFWVEWEQVPDFFNSSPSSREYVLNRSDGIVRFGDGKRGAIPPAGENNIKATYKIGGGSDGNVEAGAVSNLHDEIRLIEEVTNPSPGENGEDQESISEFVSRAPKQLRDRGKPVTKDGFERIASSAAREVARVECRAGKEETGEIGRVTLLIVPDTDERMPVPSEELLKQVEDKLVETAPETIVGDQSKLTVRGPTYVEVSVDATVHSSSVESAARIQETANSALDEFSQPLTGGPNGTGWDIGDTPAPSEFSGCLEQLDRVDYVKHISVTYREGNEQVTLTGGEGTPIVASDVLVYSGQHDVTVEFEGDR